MKKKKTFEGKKILRRVMIKSFMNKQMITT
jgi:hypothetical protein